jgi:DNA-binding transcriptional MerR regulator
MPSSMQVAEQAGVTYRQLDHWVSRGWLHPESVGTGTGHERHWPPREVRQAQDMGRLVQFGIPPELAHRIARAGQALAMEAVLIQVRTVEAHRERHPSRTGQVPGG